MANTAMVLGAGTGGVAAATRLRELLPAEDRVVLIDRSFTGSLGLSALRVLRGWRRPDEVVRELDPAALPGISLVHGAVESVDVTARRVRYRCPDGSVSDIGYDGLVVALGAALAPAALPGLNDAIAAGVAGEFYSVAGADELRCRINALESGRIVLLVPSMPFKCPPAPYEAAFFIADLLGSRFAGGEFTGTVHVEVISCEPRPIPVLGADIGAALVELLTARGIGFQPARKARRVDATGRAVVFADDTTEPFDLLAVVPPHRSSAAAVLPGLVDDAGWLPVDPATLATAAPGAWAVGDCTVLPLAHGLPLPKAGIFAEGAALVAAAQLAGHLGYDAPGELFTAEGGCVMEIGGGEAVRIAGRFLASPGPQVVLGPPSQELHDAKAAQEREWLGH